LKPKFLWVLASFRLFEINLFSFCVLITFNLSTFWHFSRSSRETRPLSSAVSLNVTLRPFIGRIFSSQDILLGRVILNA